MPFGLGIWEIVILAGILALLFGTKGVPQMARKLGGSVREVKDAVAEVDPRRMLEAPSDTKAPAQPKTKSTPPATPPAPAPPAAPTQAARPAEEPKP